MNYNLSHTSPKNEISEKIIDLRSDTVTRPSRAMIACMSQAKVGDDVYGDDPSVNELQEKVANLLSKEAGLFVSSGTQSNFCAILSHCQRGEELLTGENYHVYCDEAGGAAVLGSVMMDPLKTNADGSIPVQEIKNAKIPADAIPDLDSGNSICQNACSLVQPSVIATSDIALGICLKKPSVNQIVNGIFKATKTNIIPICVSIKPIFENIIKIGKLKDMPGIVLVNIINKKYLFLCLKLCLAKP